MLCQSWLIDNPPGRLHLISGNSGGKPWQGDVVVRRRIDYVWSDQSLQNARIAFVPSTENSPIFNKQFQLSNLQDSIQTASLFKPSGALKSYFSRDDKDA
jgi:hypothetical protein